jgi:NADH-quinone oxidoreductase subunit G
VARLKPRFNEHVNRWWICDEGRYGFDFVDDDSRLPTPWRRRGSELAALTWDEAVGEVAGVLRRFAPGEMAIIASPRMTNEDLVALHRLAAAVGMGRLGFRVPPATPGRDDDLLLRADRHPNTRGAELIGLDGDVAAILADARAGRVKGLWVFDHDLLASAWDSADTRAALDRVETIIFTGSNAQGTSELAHLGLPATAWVERDGTFTNFQGRVQRFRRAVEPLGEALPAWEIVTRVLRALGHDAPATRAEQWFRELAGSVPAFAGLTWVGLGDGGGMVRA